MKKICFIILYLLFKVSMQSQEVNIQIIYNNLNDENKFSGLNTKIKSSINAGNIQKSLRNNNNITDKNFTIQIIFYDRGNIGQHRLKQENKLTPEEYIKQWKEERSSNIVLFLFVKGFNDENYTLNKFSNSENKYTTIF